MAKANFTEQADQDLIRIVSYIAADNPSAAFRWLEETKAVCELLAAEPEIGQAIKTRRFGTIRRHVAGNYLIYYRQLAGGVEILLVSHGARDQGRLV